MSRYQPYPSYKDSGVEWLREVPDGWDFKALKYSMQSIQTGTTPSTSDQTFFDGDIHWFNPKDLNNEILKLSERKISKKAIDNNEAKLFPMDSVLIVGIGATTGKTSYLSLEASFNQQITGLHSYSNNNKYFFYQIKSFANEFLNLANFTTLPILNNEFLKNFAVVTPTLPEQTSIANFLDIQTAKIDTLIAKQQRMIELLGEKRSAMISHAVTKGLNPDVAMKEGGVEWLGAVPEHWEVKKTKTFFKLITQPAPANNDYELLSIYTDIGVRPRKDLEAKGNKASTTDSYWMVEKGDLIVNKLLAWMGAIGYSAYDGVTSPAYDILRPSLDVNSMFYHYLFRTKIAQQEFKRWSRGIMEMRLRLYFDELGNLPMPVPPKEEQSRIVEYIQKSELKIDTLIEKAQKAIELMKERRTALISAAVTGKIDVRGIA